MVVERFFSPFQSSGIPQEGVKKVLKLCCKRYIQMPLGNWFSKVPSGGNEWEEKYAYIIQASKLIQMLCLRSELLWKLL